MSDLEFHEKIVYSSLAANSFVYDTRVIDFETKIIVGWQGVGISLHEIERYLNHISVQSMIQI